MLFRSDNSSIWFRKCRLNNYQEVIAALNEFRGYHDIGLYEKPNAKEYLDYNLRQQKENFLNYNSGSHGKNVIPNLYTNELKCKLAIEEINKSDSCKIQQPEIIKFVGR